MKGIYSNFNDKIKIITPDDGYHYFFGYYDMRATATVGKRGRHLCHRVKFMDRLPLPDDVCELGYLEDGKFTAFAETTAWNFQQGALLEYCGFDESTVHYNAFEGGRFTTVIHNIDTGEQRFTDRPCANVSPDFSYGLSVNFGRIYDFRPGYGYSGYADEGGDVIAPENDGVFLVDMSTGKSRLLISYKDMQGEAGFAPEEKILVNHITFAPDSKRYLMLVRNMGGGCPKWSTSLMVGDLNGGVKTVLPCTVVSHYYWESPDKIILYASVDGQRNGLYRLDANTGEAEEIKSFFFEMKSDTDIHCILSPDGKYIIGDGYTQGDGCRPLLVINQKSGESAILLRAESPKAACTDVRCDLHVRYVYGGEYVSFDTTHAGKRQVAIFPTKCIEI